MGTNYYLYEKEPCRCCSRPYEPKHIGKSSGGWAFSLHVIPSEGINFLEDWIRLWSQPGAYIEDEYGERISTKQIYNIIVNRPPGIRRGMGPGVLPGPGSWDYVVGEFS